MRRELTLMGALDFYALLYIVCAVLIVGNVRDAPTQTTYFSGPGDLTEVTP